MAHDVFVTGSTGYIGRHLIPVLLARGHRVRALVRPESMSPSKAPEFLRVDLASARASVAAARAAGVAHFVYVSVAHPAPIMKAYIAARAEGERAISDAGLCATVLRPWYVLGPGHHWPRMLARRSTRRLGLVTLKQMVAALAHAVDHPPPAHTIRVLDVPAIRQMASPP